MKKLEDFECEKVETKTVYGGKIKEDSMTIVYSGTEVCDVHTDH